MRVNLSAMIGTDQSTVQLHNIQMILLKIAESWCVRFLYSSSEHCPCYHNGTMAPHYKLTYFGLRARAEPTRIVFAYAGVDYEDVRISWENRAEEWPPVKNSKYETRVKLRIKQASVKRQRLEAKLCVMTQMYGKKKIAYSHLISRFWRDSISRGFIFARE